MPTNPEFFPPTRATRTKDIVRAAVNAGRPLPLTVILECMWKFREDALRLEEPGEGQDLLAARSARSAAVQCAEKAAPYVHPKLANVAVRSEDEEEASQRRANQALTAEQLKGRSVAELGRLYLQIARGEEVDLADATIKGEAVEVDGAEPEPQEPPEAEPETSVNTRRTVE